MALRKRSPKRFALDRPVGNLTSKVAFQVHSDGTVAAAPLGYGLRNVRCWFLGVRNGFGLYKSTRSEAEYAVPMKGV